MFDHMVPPPSLTMLHIHASCNQGTLQASCHTWKLVMCVPCNFNHG